MDDGKSAPRTFPPGVTCWVDLQAPDVEAASEFYAGLFGWELDDVTPPDAPARYRVATLDGHDAAGIGASGGSGEDRASWVTYVATDDADASLARALTLGGTQVAPAADAGPGGRAAAFADPQGHEIALWQPRRRLGVQIANTPGAWNFSNLRTADVPGARRFYGVLFGWEFLDQGWATTIQVPGYGDHLAATVDPDIRERQRDAPEGFADTIGGIDAVEKGSAGHPDGKQPGWHVVFTVADRDEAATTAERLGATILSRPDTGWTREAVIRDPQAAVLTLSQFAPPTDWD